MVLSIMGISTGGESGGFSIYIIYPMTEQLKKQKKTNNVYINNNLKSESTLACRLYPICLHTCNRMLCMYMLCRYHFHY